MEREHEAAPRELKRALILAAAIIFAAFAAFAAALAETGLFTRLEVGFTAGETESLVYVQPGEAAPFDSAELPAGTRLLCWLGPDGAEADTEAALYEDASFTALLGPALAPAMEPWLERDEHGFALPDEPVTGAEAARGAAAMFAPEVDITALERLDTVSEAQLASALEGFFTPGALDYLDGAEPMTRLEAAGALYTLYMDSLYGGAWGFDAVYRVAAPDLDPMREGAGCLAACLAGEERQYAEGICFIDGYQYRADETGLFIMDEEADGLYYGPDGRYTSGDEELDALVAAALRPICAEYETRGEMLRAAYIYVRDEFDYLRRHYYGVGAEGWQTEEAKTMLATRRGNCYNYAAAFWALARGLGYDAAAVAGTVGWERSLHGWVIMYDEEGERVVYDVELEMAYRYQRGLMDTDLYAMYPADTEWWHYVYGEQYE